MKEEQNSGFNPSGLIGLLFPLLVVGFVLFAANKSLKK